MKEILIISLLGIVILALDILKLRKLLLPSLFIGMLGLIGSAIMDWGQNEIPFAQYGGMLQFDNYALIFTIAFAWIALAWFLMNSDHYALNSSKRTDIYAMVAFSLCGAVVLVSFTNLVMLFLGVEILSIPVYVLAASNRTDKLSNEAGFKYFFMGSVASAILLFGIALIYGATGSFELTKIQEMIATSSHHGVLFTLGSSLMLIGFLFKVSAAPFHMWTPDVYQGAPTPITAYMSTIVKGAAVAGMFRLFLNIGAGPQENLTTALVVIIALTLIVSNVIAAVQTNAKRLLAYSSVSHAGFMLGFLVHVQAENSMYLFFYVLTYSLASFAAFSVVQHVSQYQQGATDVLSFKGLNKQNRLLAFTMTVALLSMAGIPPLSGFMAKYYVMSDLVAHGHLPLVIIMVITSAIGAYYYLKLIMEIYTPIDNAGRIVIGTWQRWMYMKLLTLLIALFFASSLLQLLVIP
ncbi:MAG: NADH-quinone oxidoreductase subunit N [Flavobacteriales bacterium]